MWHTRCGIHGLLQPRLRLLGPAVLIFKEFDAFNTVSRFKKFSLACTFAIRACSLLAEFAPHFPPRQNKQTCRDLAPAAGPSRFRERTEPRPLRVLGGVLCFALPPQRHLPLQAPRQSPPHPLPSQPHHARRFRGWRLRPLAQHRPAPLLYPRVCHVSAWLLLER